MDYKFTFEDGSEAIAHFGVKGMRWGVRNAETRERYARAGGSPREYQKRLNTLDKDMRAANIGRRRLERQSENYRKKSERQKVKGDSEKAAKFSDIANRTDIAIGKVSDYQKKIGKEMIDVLTAADKAGYSWKVQKTEFNEAMPGKSNKRIREAIGDYPKRLQVTPYSDASSGNRFTVRDASKQSAKKQAKWKTKHNLNDYRNQRVYKYYY